jgi:hypothetical protein
MKTYDFDNVDLAIIFIGLIAVSFSVPHLLEGGSIADISSLVSQCILAIAALATGKVNGKGP